jgi:hypothetical protein
MLGRQPKGFLDLRIFRIFPLAGLSMVMAVAAVACGGKDENPKPPTPGGPTPTVAPADPVVLATWAKGFCQALSVYAAGSTRLPSGGGLPFEQKKTTAITNARTIIESSERGLAAFAVLQPPPTARAFQQSYVGFVTAHIQALQRVLPRLEAARAESDLDAANIEIDVNIKPYRTDVTEKVNALPTDVAAAINGIADCGRPPP